VRTAEPVIGAATAAVGAVASQATGSVEPLATAAVGTVTGTLEAASTALPSETQALLGPLVATVDGQAEELAGSLLGPTATGLGETVRTVTGATPSVESSGDGVAVPWSPGDGGPGPMQEPVESASTTASRPAAGDGTPRVFPTGAGPALDAPWFPAATTSGPAAGSHGADAGADVGSPGAPPRPVQPNAPSAPTSAFGSSAGSSVASAVLAGLFALALGALLGRLLPWSDAIRPLAFVSPPDRPG
jgi:hypothetical protein